MNFNKISKNLSQLSRLKTKQRQKIEQELARLKEKKQALDNEVANITYLMDNNRTTKLSDSKLFYTKITIDKFDTNDIRNFEIKQNKFETEYNGLNEQKVTLQQSIKDNLSQQEETRQKIKKLHVKLEKYEFISNQSVI